MIPKREQWKRWSLPTKYNALAFVLAVIGTVIAVVGLAFSYMALPSSHPPAPFFASLNELFANSERLRSCEAADCEGLSLDFERTSVLFNDYFDQVAGDAYGEQTHLFEVVQRMRTFKEIKKPTAAQVAFARFEIEFLIWYIMPSALPTFSENQKAVYFWHLPLKDCAPAGSYVLMDGAVIKCYIDYLGYLD